MRLPVAASSSIASSISATVGRVTSLAIVSLGQQWFHSSSAEALRLLLDPIFRAVLSPSVGYECFFAEQRGRLGGLGGNPREPCLEVIARGAQSQQREARALDPDQLRSTRLVEALLCPHPAIPPSGALRDSADPFASVPAAAPAPHEVCSELVDPEEPRLAEADVDETYPELWARYARLAAEEAYRYEGREALYEQLFGSYVPDPFYVPGKRAAGGAGGEGPFHKALREWVWKHPKHVDKRLRDVDSRTEADLLSCDRVDIVYRTPDEVVAIEVKSRISDWDDFRRGVYQCVKYRAVMKAQEQEEKSGRRVRALLVTETPLPVDLARTAKRLRVRHLEVPPVGR